MGYRGLLEVKGGVGNDDDDIAALLNRDGLTSSTGKPLSCRHDKLDPLQGSLRALLERSPSMKFASGTESACMSCITAAPVTMTLVETWLLHGVTPGLLIRASTSG
jgi:hypothetical protein